MPLLNIRNALVLLVLRTLGGAGIKSHLILTSYPMHSDVALPGSAQHESDFFPPSPQVPTFPRAEYLFKGVTQ
ncbi:hypothetical protein GCM10007902_46180 [Dyella nitratireducens]|nr:hypothetical protein GCM10007902_46180 [Dyella nitratireducens]